MNEQSGLTHILAHGDLDESTHGSYGLVLRGPDESADAISGERFCSALTAVGNGRIHRPTVVTVASCDSGNVGTVVRPGASFAHALHQGGVPLVVASQFPLSTEGSVPLLATLYTGLLWGERAIAHAVEVDLAERKMDACDLVDHAWAHGSLAEHYNYLTRYNDVWARPDLQERHGDTTTYRKDDQASSKLSLLPAGGSA